MARLGIDRDFLFEFGTLEQHVQRKVHEAFEKFQQATHAGAHLEKIANVRDDRLRSIRIDQSWRGIVLAPETGDTYTLLTVRHHDDAYAWAQRRRFSVNRATGTIEMRDIVGLEEEMPKLAEHAGSQPPLLGHVNDADLIRLGVDEQILPLARMLTDATQLDALRTLLPGPQFDALYGLASGMTPDEVWSELAAALLPPPGGYDTDDVAAAVERSPHQVVLVSGPDELMEVFAYPFALWRVFLHPAQHQVAYATYRGPARVTGGPGTGKTVAALHRVKHLAAAGGPPASILLTTFTRTLAESLDDSVTMLVEEPVQRARIDVRTIDQLANKIVAAQHGRVRVVPAVDQDARWSRLAAAHGVDATAAFLRQEWQEVLLAQEITDLDGYLAASRAGRGRPLDRGRRAALWPVLAGFGAELAAEKVWTWETIVVEATRLLAGAAAKPYQHVVVDEAQDLAPWQWRLLRAAVPSGPDDLFLAGDTHQRIYAHRVSLRRVGIDIAGRSTRLAVNYRTTAEILGWSLGLLRGEPVDDMDGSLDTLAGCRSDVHGAAPVLTGTPSRAIELDRLVATVRSWLASGVEPGQIGIAARSTALVDHVVTALTGAGHPAVSLGRRPARNGEIGAATMHRMKGLEFRCVAVVGVGENQVPASSAVTSVHDDVSSHNLDLQRERCLLFVACTRAREQLAVSWHGAPSPFLVGLTDPDPG